MFPSDLGQYGTWATIAYLIILIAMVPGVLFVLGRVALSNFHPEPHQMNEVRELSNQIETSASTLLRIATQEFGGSQAERDTLESLLVLIDRAEKFRIRVQSVSARPSVGEHEFRELFQAFAEARNLFPSVLKSGRAREEALDFSRMIEILRFYYEPVPRQGSTSESPLTPMDLRPAEKQPEDQVH